MSGALALALGLLLAGQPPAQASPSPASAAPAAMDTDTLLLDVCVDDVCDGIAVVLVRGSQVLVDRAALQKAGVPLDAGVATERVDGRDFVAADAIGHGIRIAIDHAQLRLDIRRPATVLPLQRADFHAPPPQLDGARDWSAVLDYAANLGSRRDARNLFVDGAVGRGPWALRSDGQWWSDGGWRRGLTRLEFDQPRTLRRWTFGDQYALSPDPLGGSALLGGVGVARAFDLDPFLITFPQPYLDGVLQAPGTVEVYANGVLVGRQPLQAGPFSLQGLGLSPGRNDVRLLLRDPFGGTRELSSASYYSASGLLAPGLSEYALRLGRARPSPLEDRYRDDPVLAGYWRRGLNPALTVGVRAEADRELRNLGAQAALRLPLGELSASLARSDGPAAADRGGASALDYRYSNRVAGWSLGLRRFDRGYRRLGDTSADDSLGSLLRQPRGDAFAAVGWSPTARVSLQLHWSRNRYFDAGDDTRYGLDGSLRLGADTRLFLALARNDGDGGRDTVAQLGLSLALGRDNLNLGSRHDGNGWGYGIDANRSRPSDTGFGYSASLDRQNGTDVAYARGEYQGRHGRYALTVQDADGASQASVLLSGALVAIGGRAFATPPVDNGFALVRVPGLAGVQVRRENLAVGVTDAAGELLVRDLLPYYPNRIGYDEADVPADWDIGPNALTVAVPRRGGAVVPFQARPLRAIAGRLRLPQSGAATVRLHGDGRDYSTRIGSSARYYLEDVAPGAYVLEVELDNGARARCTLQVPVLAPGVTRLEPVDCREGP
ncbi:fimbria/pilus outer membrane usher protein [Cognatiluteimonas weifangensis]|uniref:Fimbrial biogenesis outer membrane usher protein n=1 Tax=Cognatiluteimonas weifangensis TaxID=2303539 RepID=A0A372DQU7_9GAMM|nr:fimbria/pilus outer membrane usher protein [Luteimonas weifangensis]RFP61864.1 fimbrial biogenesis outer membrane usher protein [Luteimonas weifangensis]